MKKKKAKRSSKKAVKKRTRKVKKSSPKNKKIKKRSYTKKVKKLSSRKVSASETTNLTSQNDSTLADILSPSPVLNNVGGPRAEDLLERTKSRPEDWKERETKKERQARISQDPIPQVRERPAPDYPTIEKHYLIVVDADLANVSLPYPPGYEDEDGNPAMRKLGELMISDRRDVPPGFIKKPGAGVLVDTIKDTYPELHAKLIEKKISRF